MRRACGPGRNARMRRRGLLPGMLALFALLAAAVCAGSPYVPAAQKAPVDIEAIWAIEDAREENCVLSMW